ncbi:MAG: S-layer homology domain-containing protein [Clostridia bacterium]|jgi:hypothetical protein|nr:S-layer homology domain-containing protein [Clostridia bacterium]
MVKRLIWLITLCFTAAIMPSMVFADNAPKTVTKTANETRAMVVTTLFKGEDTTKNENPAVFTDVKDGTDYYVLVNWAAEKGILSGFGDGTFKPDENITKEQFAMILYKYAVYKNYDTTQGGMAIREFADYNDISPWALRAVAWSLYSGLMTGSKTDNEYALYEPQSCITQEYANSVISVFIEKNKSN